MQTVWRDLACHELQRSICRESSHQRRGRVGAEEIARLAGAAPIGLVPARRTAVTFEVPNAYNITQWPMVIDTAATLYFKPDAGRMLASPVDATPSPPCDAQPALIDVAHLMQRIEAATVFAPPRLAAQWAGLRSFVADRNIVTGFDSTVSGFFWLAGQGGAGVQTAPAVAEVVAALIVNQSLPPRLQDLAIDPGDLSPARLEPHLPSRCESGPRRRGPVRVLP